MRLRCPRCSTIVEGTPGGVVVCPSCGFSATVPGAPAAPARPYAGTMPVAPPPPAPAPAPPVSEPLGRGPVGRPRSVAFPIVLGILTFGIYAYASLARGSREMDEFAQRPRYASPRAYLGAALYAVGVLAIVLTIGTAFAMGIRSASTEDVEASALALLGGGLLIGAVLMLAGFITTALGMWKTWRLMEIEDQRRRRPGDERMPFSATLALVLYLLMIVPSAGSICFYVAVGITQSGLNRIWIANGARRN